MKRLPSTDNSLLLRTDFTDDLAWNSLCDAIRKPNESGFLAYFDYVSDSSYDGLSVERLTNIAIDNEKHSFICEARRITLSDREQPILVIDCYNQPGRTFRVIPSEVWGVENNLSIANMDFEEFADNCDPDGVFRGF